MAERPALSSRLPMIAARTARGSVRINGQVSSRLGESRKTVAVDPIETGGVSWREARTDDLDRIMSIQDTVHALLPERREVIAEKLHLFPDGCRILALGEASIGYAIAHPWMLGSIPKLDALMGHIPDTADCFYLHDVAILPAGRGMGAGKSFVRSVAALAEGRAIRDLALVSVYGTVGIWRACGFDVRAIDEMAQTLQRYGDEARYMTRRVG